jgi:Family of unknown function (DUF6011)/SWIM zinc finger
MDTAGRVTCQDCGRTLRAARSRALGRGPTCRAKIRRAAQAAQTDVKPEQLAKAVELIDDGGIVPVSRPGVYAATSSDGTTIYVANLNDGTCTCKAGQHGRYCYHLLAASILRTARTSRRAA